MKNKIKSIIIKLIIFILKKMEVSYTLHYKNKNFIAKSGECKERLYVDGYIGIGV